MGVSHLLNRELSVYRTTGVRTPTGGLAEERSLVGQVWARVPQPSSPSEQVLARTGVGPQQGGGEMVHPIWTEPDEDIRRGDELHDPETGQTWRVVVAVRPSVDGVYLRLDVEIVQTEEVGP